MKILVNGSTLGATKTGLGVYSANILSRLGSNLSFSLLCSDTRDFHCDKVYRSPHSIVIGLGFFAAVKRFVWSLAYKVPDNYFVYSPTHHALSNARFQAVTIHDLIPLSFPKQYFLQHLFFRVYIKKKIRNYTAIFTVSNAVKNEINKYYKYPLDDIYVVPNGVDAKSFSRKSTHELDTANPFLLVVGARYPHKNVEEVLNFYKVWADKYNLVICSCHGTYEKRLRQISRKLRISNKVSFKGHVTESELFAFYRKCSALVYPSLAEGFGIPPLEALASGRPAIVSDIPVHREVLSDAGIYVKLGSVSSWKEAISNLSDNEFIRHKMLAAERVVANHSWDNSVQILSSNIKLIMGKIE